MFNRKGFTLIEVMIVVAIIGLIVRVVVPAFLGTRERAQRDVCLTHLKHIEDAKAQWALWDGHTGDETPAWGDLVPEYLKDMPVCPSGGTYTIRSVDQRPSCSIATHRLPGT